MKKIIIIVVTIFVFLLSTIYIGAFVYINKNGKQILIKTISDNLKITPSVESFKLKFPLIVEIKNLELGDIVIRKVDVYPGFYNPFDSHIVIARVDVDGFTAKVTRKGYKIVLSPFFSKNTDIKNNYVWFKPTIELIPNAYALGNQAPPFIINNLYLKNGSIELTDILTNNSTKFIISDISLKLHDLVYPELTKLGVDIKSALLNNNSIKSDILAKGWLDLARKNMDLNVTVSNIDCFTFNDYYPENWKPVDLGIKEGLASLTLGLKAVNNQLGINGTITIKNIVFNDNIEDNSRAKTTRTVLAFLKLDNEYPVFNFSQTTKMDKPQIDYIQLKQDLKKIAQKSMANAAGNLLSSVISKEEDGSTKIDLDKAEDALKGVGESIKDMFKSYKRKESE